MQEEDVEDKSSHSFLDELSKVSEAEKNASLLIESTSKKAQEIIKQANLEASKIIADSSEHSIKIKNQIIAKEKKKTETKVSQILTNAKKEAEKIKKLSLTKEQLHSLLDILIE
ncbi:MAG: hypothetical protein ACK4J0_02450 [Candidatus Anstonellaceae archaeon]